MGREGCKRHHSGAEKGMWGVRTYLNRGYRRCVPLEGIERACGVREMPSSEFDEGCKGACGIQNKTPSGIKGFERTKEVPSEGIKGTSSEGTRKYFWFRANLHSEETTRRTRIYRDSILKRTKYSEFLFRYSSTHIIQRWTVDSLLQ